MSEKKLTEKLKRGWILIICFSLLFFLLGCIFLSYSRRSTMRLVENEIQQETEDYRSQILRQLDNDQKALHTIASLLASTGMTSPEAAAETLASSISENDFLTIGCFNREGIGIMTSGEGNIEWNVDYRTLSDAVIEAVGKSMTGEDSISRLFDSQISDRRVFIGSVPIYQNGEIIGVLCASSHVDMFEEILNRNTLGARAGFVNLIGSDGNILVHFPHALVEQQYTSIFDIETISEEDRAGITAALQAGEDYFSSFHYQGDTCYYYLSPIGINGWYLFYINFQERILAQETISTMSLAFFAILLLVAGFLVYSSRLVRKSNRELSYITNHDSLTGAMNFRCFSERFQEAILLPEDFCLAVINIHQFKFINELFGRSYGDQLLRAVKEILDEHLESGEFFCRNHADAFYLYLKGCDKEVLTRRLKTIFRQIAHWSWNNQNTYQILMYTGAVEVAGDCPPEKKQYADLMTHVMFALDKARELPADAVWFYDVELHEVEKTENYIESHMNLALEQKEFQLYLQPKFRLSDHTLGSAEALVRWIAQDGRTIFPGQFIPLFERNGFCVQLDLYMLELVCREIARWREAGLPLLPVSVNQSKPLFYEADYIQRLSDLMEKYQIPANLITLEILEGLAAENAEILNEKIKHIQKLGFRVSMDDFGSGYSSFHTLANLQIDELKLDRSFLLERSRGQHSRIQIIMKHIIRMAQNLHISTVAEGVETPEEEAFIASLGCDYGQGYLYSRPLPAAEFEEKYLMPQTGAQKEV